jgi:cobalt-precorrin 5A hydrolase
MKTALITLSVEGMLLADRLLNAIPEACLYLHDSIDRGVINRSKPDAKVISFAGIVDLTHNIFSEYEGLIYFAPCGVVVRALAQNIKSKLTDPAVVAVDIGGRFAISLLSGHEGGANELALMTANVLGAEPVISTSTEAVKSIIVGVGCRKGVEARRIIDAIRTACRLAKVAETDIRLLASADIKSNETGVIEAARELGLPLRFIASEEIRRSNLPFTRSEFVKEKVDLPAIAEPAALLSGRRTSLILPKTSFNGITVAIARESFLWSDLVPETP